ncbi:uncharacterized protein LOC118348025 [Juglans regia]|uniref:Uncharacterized protein LOC118348025 n=1 Tax=Juglans regia TaxID=51240 RepID=A0A6P9EB46_JUGRE|nr:uncharacterized protein LOC118348025 [Juglans regia]
MACSFFRKFLTYLSSDDELDIVLNAETDGESSRYRGNCQHQKFIQRDHIQGHERLFLDYFAENSVEAYEPYFIQRRDNTGRLGFSSMQKITVAFRMLAYGVTGYFMDEYIRIRESIAIESLKKFYKTIEALIACIGSGKIVSLPGKRYFIFTEFAQGRAPRVNYTINDNDYTMGYYLADGIYLKWSMFVKTIPSP